MTTQEGRDEQPPEGEGDAPPPSERRLDGFVAASIALGMAAGFLMGSHTNVKELFEARSYVDSSALSRAVPWKPEIVAGVGVVEKRELARLQEEMKSIRSRLETMRRTNDAQRVGERLRALESERQSDADAKRSADKAADKVDRMEKRLDALERTKLERPAPDASSKSDLDALSPKPPTRRKTRTEIDGRKAPGGYVLREACDSVALVERKGGAMEEVSKGDSLPGAGKVRAIERRGNGWVVVTSRGVIDRDP